jgi:hypothetical protein
MMWVCIIEVEELTQWRDGRDAEYSVDVREIKVEELPPVETSVGICKTNVVR